MALTLRTSDESSFSAKLAGSDESSQVPQPSGWPAGARRDRAWADCLKCVHIRSGEVVGVVGEPAHIPGDWLRQLGSEPVFAETLDAAHWDDQSMSLVVLTDLYGYRWWRWSLQECIRILRPGGWLIARIADRSKAPTGMGAIGITHPTAALRQVRHMAFHVEAATAYGVRPSVRGRLGIASRWIEHLFFVSPLAKRCAAEYLLLCRKPEDYFGRYCQAVLARIRRHHENFIRMHSELIQARRAWLDSHPGFPRYEPREWRPDEVDASRILVLAPHPDDEIIGCGGTLLRLREIDASIHVLYLTDGRQAAALQDVASDDRAAVRRHEAERVARRMGFSDVRFWATPDGHLVATGDAVRGLAGVLNEIQPCIVFVPAITDPHPDHRAANVLLLEAMKQYRAVGGNAAPEIFGYEVWGLLPPHVYCTVDRQMPWKLSALLDYPTGLKGQDYVRYARDLGAYHAYALTRKPGFVEVFTRFGGEKYIQILGSILNADSPQTGRGA